MWVGLAAWWREPEPAVAVLAVAVLAAAVLTVAAARAPWRVRQREEQQGRQWQRGWWGRQWQRGWWEMVGLPTQGRQRHAQEWQGW